MKITFCILIALCCSCFYTAMAQPTFFLNNGDNREPDLLDQAFGNNGVSVMSPGGSYNFFVLTTTLVQNNGDLTGVGFVNKDSLFNFQIALFRTDPDGFPDSSFGTGGWTFTNLPGSVEVRKAVLLSDNKILVTGSVENGASRDIFLVKYTSEGIADSTFGNAGVVLTDLNGNADYAFDLITDESGNIFVAGKTVDSGIADVLITSYDVNGILRPSFGTAGKKVLDAGSDDESAVGICIQPGNRIVIGGESAGDFLLAALNTSGELDLTFGQGGMTSVTLESTSVENAGDLLMDDAGQLYLAGTSNASISDGKKSFVTAKFDANGVPDLSYGLNGVVQKDVCTGKDDIVQEAFLLANNELLLTGYSGNAGDYMLSTIKLTSSGEVSPESGILLTDFDLTQEVAQDIFVQQDGKIVVSGYAMSGSWCSGFILRYDPEKYLQTTARNQDIRIYPNPATTHLFLEITELKESLDVFVYNIHGQLIHTSRFSDSPYCQLDLREFGNGCYSLSIPQMNIQKQFVVINR